MNRRSFFAACAAPFLARFAPKPTVVARKGDIFRLINQRMDDAYMRMHEEMARQMFQPSTVFYRMADRGTYAYGPYNSEGKKIPDPFIREDA